MGAPFSIFLFISLPHPIYRQFIRYAMRYAYVSTITLPIPVNLFFAKQTLIEHIKN